MAQAIAFHSGSPLIGSPLTYRVTPSAHGANYTFHRVTLRVMAGLETDVDYTVFDFSTQVNSSAPVLFDISSALRAVADKYAFSVIPPQRYPYIKFKLEAFDDYMIDGTLYEHQGSKEYPGYGHFLFAFMGAFTDMERLTAQTDGMGLEWWTRKPLTSPEVVFVGKKVVLPSYFVAGIGNVNCITTSSDSSSSDDDPEYPVTPTAGPKSTEITISNSGLQTLYNDHDYKFQVYAITASDDSYEIRFINSLGCEESVHVTCLRTAEVNIHTDKYAIARQETFRVFSRSLAVKSNNREQWKMSSGALDRAWLQWYLHEFLMARQAWILVNGNWLPINILPEETTTGMNRTKADMLSVEFTIEFDMDGSPY